MGLPNMGREEDGDDKAKVQRQKTKAAYGHSIHDPFGSSKHG